MFVISIDSDWAIQQLLDDVVDILNSYKIKGTFFLTNEINFANFKEHELAIHPNFEGTTDFENILKKTISFLPSKKTKGTRSHKLYYNGNLPIYYKKLGIEYDSNYILPNYDNPHPFYIPKTSILEIPFFFGDDSLFTENSDFSLDSIDLKDSGVKVFMFHPIHIFLNSRTSDDYEKIKPKYTNYEYLKSNQNSEKNGIRTFFTNLLDFIEKNKIETKTMAEINDLWRNNPSQI